MKLLGEYINGNYTVKIFNDGTKIRETEGDDFIPSFPESMDISITDRCDNNCAFCYAGATKDGKHGDIMGAKFIDTLKPFTEVALNGNDISQPDLFGFLQKLKDKNIIASMTFNQVHFMRYKNTIKALVKDDLIKGLGISLIDPSNEFIAEVKKFPNAVIHIINGITTIEQVEKLYDNDLKVLILGYKEIGRGKDYYCELVEYNKDIFYDEIETIIQKFKVVSFDNLALAQLELKRVMSKEQWQEFYMGNDGSFTLYVDIPKGYFARSSVSTNKYSILDNIDEMFKIIQNENLGMAI